MNGTGWKTTESMGTEPKAGKPNPTESMGMEPKAGIPNTTEWNKTELLRKVGSIQQVACIRPLRMEEGRSAGMRAFDLRNGPMRALIMADKCLDIAEFSYKGVNISFLSKPGLQGRGSYDTNGQEAQRSIMGGLFFTAGFENICSPYESGGKSYPMHGRMRTTPAEHVCADARFLKGSSAGEDSSGALLQTEAAESAGERYVLSVSGEMREAELFGENIVLRRRIETEYGSRTLTVTDEIENQSYRREPLMLLYHINIGYPLLDEDSEILLPTRHVAARDEASRGKEDRWNRMDPPRDNEPEYVFLHEPIPAPDKTVSACVLNERLHMGIRIKYSVENLPYFMEWKSTGSGDYVVGLEPSNSLVYGRGYHEERGDLHTLGPFEKEVNVLRFTVLEGEELDEARREAL